MIEIRKLKKDDMEELFELLNTTFGNKYGRAMHFDLEQPKMWVKDDLHMERHLAVFEDGKMAAVVGVYPLPLVIDGEDFLFFTTGNVATLPQYEGKGYFSKLFPLALEEARKQGATAARLGGARQRYARYGFEACGPAYEFTFTMQNTKALAAEGDAYTLCPIRREDTEILAYCHTLMEKKRVFVRRGTEENYRDMFLALGSKESTPYLVKKNGKSVGYVSGSKNLTHIYECGFEDDRDVLYAVYAAQKMNPSERIAILLPETMPAAVNAMQSAAQEVALCQPSRFYIMEYKRLVNRLLKVANDLCPLPDFDLSIAIEGAEAIALHKGADGCCATAADTKNCDIALSGLEAERLLFGIANADLLAKLPMEKRAVLKAVFPLPLTWCTLDYV